MTCAYVTPVPPITNNGGHKNKAETNLREGKKEQNEGGGGGGGGRKGPGG